MATLLIVEDDRTLGVSLATYMTEGGLHTVLAPDGHQALSALGAVAPDVILLDMTLPDMDGLLVLEAVRRQPRGATTPVIVYSSRDEPARVRQAQALGVVEYLVKGRCSLREILSSIEAHVHA